MQLSKYALFVDDYPNPGEHLVYHTRTQALVKIDRNLKDFLDSLEEPDFRWDGSREEELKTLYRMGVVVKDQAEDEEKLARFMEQKKYGIDKAYFLATILTTYNCNFACTYCFEETTRTSNQRLERPTADLIMAWIKRKVEKLGIKLLQVDYYGGEPLLNQPMIEYMTKELRSWCFSKGVGFQMIVQTNGLLLTPEFVDKYVPLGLTSAQISVDGTKEVHDRQRPMRGTGQGTFDTVIRNIVASVDKINITIAAGYDKGDPTGILELLDYLDSIGVLKKLRKFVPSPIHPTLGPKGHTEDIVSPGCMSNYSSDTLIRSTKIINEAMAKKGMPVKSGLSASMCPVTSGDSGVTIDTNGLIFKCSAMLGHPELAVGNVREEAYNEQDRRFMSAEPWKLCDADCPYAPLCNTGCRLFSFFKNQDFLAKSCERDYMDKFVPEAVKKEYQNQLKRKTKQEAAVLSS